MPACLPACPASPPSLALSCHTSLRLSSTSSSFCSLPLLPRRPLPPPPPPLSLLVPPLLFLPPSSLPPPPPPPPGPACPLGACSHAGSSSIYLRTLQRRVRNRQRTCR